MDFGRTLQLSVSFVTFGLGRANELLCEKQTVVWLCCLVRQFKNELKGPNAFPSRLLLSDLRPFQVAQSRFSFFQDGIFEQSLLCELGAPKDFLYAADF